MKTVLRTSMLIALAACFCSSCHKQEDKNTTSSKPVKTSKSKKPTWHVLENTSAGFEILMPTEPKKQGKKEDTDNGPVTTTAYLSLKDKAAYSVVITNMPLAIANGIDPEKEFDDTIKKLQKKTSGQILKQNSSEIDGNKTILFTMLGDGPTGQTLYRVKIIRLGQNTIQLMTAHPKSEDMASDAKFFFDSFKLKTAP